jgi:glycosyltransferase involved in cell wall biosynthesis
MKRLTILSVAYSLAPVTRATSGGAEQVLSMLDEAIVAAGHRSIVVAYAGSELQGELVSTPEADWPLTDDVQRAARARHRMALESVLKTTHVDVIHFHGIDVADVVTPTAIPMVTTVHLPPEWYPADFLMRRDMHFVCVSNSQRAKFPGEAGVIHNGVDLNIFHPGRGTRDPGQFVFALGRICEEKNLHAAIDAARMADVDLILAGGVSGYPAHQEYFHERVEPRLDARRQFIGSVGLPEKAEYFANARCVLVPSLVAETSSLVAMEALACGTPVIAFRSGALPEVVQHGVTGFIVDSTDEMAQAIGRIDTIDRARCRRVAEERFDARRMAAEYLDLYTRIAACDAHSSLPASASPAVA